MPLATIEDALADLRRGKFVIVVDGEDRDAVGVDGVTDVLGHVLFLVWCRVRRAR